MASPKPRIVLFKAPTEEEDPYRVILERYHYQVDFISPLEFQFCNLDGLQDALQSPERFRGLVLTSPRSIEAVARVKSSVGNFAQNWNSKPVFVVGHKSAQLVRDLLDLAQIWGQDSGSAENLVDVISHHLGAGQRILFPCGNLRGETMPRRLGDLGIHLISIACYQTAESKALANELEQKIVGKLPDFLVFFSPSGVRFVLNHLDKSEVSSAKLVAIGPSTRREILSLELKVFATCAKPNALNLINALNT